MSDGVRSGLMHGYRIGAGRLGISLAEYLQHIEAGQKWCHGHQEWCARTAFARSSRYLDGLTRSCLLGHRLQVGDQMRRKRATAKGAA